MTLKRNTIEAQGLSHEFRRFRSATRALDDVTLEVGPGAIFGLLGRNGAGKTTLVKILLGLIHPTAGTAHILGERPSSHRMRRRIGYLPEQMRLPEHMKAAGFLNFMGRINRVPETTLRVKIPALLERMELAGARSKLLREYSKGMTQRIGIAQALLNDPEVLFLDEPTDGLDPLGRKQVRDLLSELRAAGKTIFLNSHLLSEIELVCDHVVIMEKGRVIRTGSPRDLVTASGEYRVRVASVTDAVRRAVESAIGPATWEANTLRFRPLDTAQLNRLIDALRAVPVEIETVEPVKSTLEESFIAAVAGKAN